MSIRLKFFLVLLTFSLVPLLAVTFSSRRSIIHLGRDLSRELQSSQNAAISEELVNSAENSAAAIGQNVASLQMSLHYLAASTSGVLDRPGTPKGGTLYTPADFKRPETAPTDLQMSWRYARAAPGGVLKPSAISLQHPVFVIPSGRETALAPEIRRILDRVPVFQDIYRVNGVAHRVYVGFESGLHVSFPGHGHLPPSFDPRRRPWYIQARRRGELTWLSHEDSSTRKFVFTVAVPLYDASGRFTGAAAIDMLPEEFMAMDQLRGQWSADTLAFLVLPEPPGSRTPERLRIVARGGREEENGDAATQEGYLQVADPEHRQRLNASLQNRASGSLELPYGNTASIWAFARLPSPLDESLRLILIVPQSVVSTLSQQVGRSVLDQTYAIYRVTGVIALLLLGLVLLMGWIGTRTILRPLYVIVEAWERLSTGDFSVRIDERTGDERDTLIVAFNDIVPRLEAHWDLNRSLELARRIQRNLMPQEDPDFPRLDIAGNIYYCEQTGGDYYDVFESGPSGSGRVAVVVGDVSGHGVASALLMTTARAMIRSMSVLERDVAKRITSVNRLLMPDIAVSGDFITLFYLECDLVHWRFSWVRAGHDPALRYDPQTDRFSELGGVGMALGLSAEAAYRAFSLPMGEPGEIIAIGTDGIWEARDPGGQMFGKDRLRRIIRKHHRSSAKMIRDAVFEAVADFTAQFQKDDITLVVLKLAGRPGEGRRPRPASEGLTESG